jgi:predicted TIM-barrel fold metal-dependent hydrolase
MNRPSMVDAHVHLWNLDTQNHEWLSDEWSESQAAYLGDYTPLKRNYLVENLLDDFEGNDVVKAVHVQADWGGNQVDETRWLQSLADEHGFPHGIVARTDLRRPDATAELEDHLRSPNMRGIRQLALQPGLFVDPAFRRGFADLARLGLTFDLGTLWQGMDQGYDLVKAFPDTMFVVDHAGMPLDRAPEHLEGWRKAIRMMAAAPNVLVKVSGLGMGDHHWTVDSLRPMVLATIETFGPERSMLATNWPVDRLYSSYGELMAAYEAITSGFTPDELHGLWRGNAERFYRI